MTDPTADSDDSENRPVDWLATHGTYWARGVSENQAIRGVLERSGPWSDEWAEGRDGVTVYVWKLYADSWTHIKMGAPERGAEQLEYREYLIPADEANAFYDEIEGVDLALDSALAEAETVEEEGRPDDN